MKLLTHEHLEEKYGQIYSDAFQECISAKVEINICEDTIYRMENEMIKRGENIESQLISISNASESNELQEYIEKTGRRNFIILIITGFRIPKIEHIIRDNLPEEDVEINMAMIRKTEAPFMNEFLILAY